MRRWNSFINSISVTEALLTGFMIGVCIGGATVFGLLLWTLVRML